MAMTGRRKLLVGGSFLLTVVAGLAVALMVNWIGFRHYRRFDWTRSKVYSISEKTRSVLARLEEPLKIVVFLTEDKSPVYHEVRELADRYVAASPHVKVEMVDPFRSPVRAREVAQRFGLDRASFVVFEYGEREKLRRHFVEASRLVEYDYSGLAFNEPPRLETFQGEEVFTQAILGLVERKMRLVFTAGHGEPSFQDPGDAGYKEATEALRRESYEVQEWTGLNAERVPEGTDILAVVGPKKSFLPNEVEAIRAFLAGGGKALFLLDPQFRLGENELVELGIEPLLAEWGVEVGRNIVVDPDGAMLGIGPDTLFTNRYAPHPITRGLEGSALILPLARTISAKKPPAGSEARVLVESSLDGWGENDLASLPKVERGEGDVAGPAPLAVAVGPLTKSLNEEMEKSVPGMPKGDPPPDRSKARIVVFGDSELASNMFFERNAQHFLASVNWLAVREDSLGIPPKKVGKVRIDLAPQQLDRIGWIILALMPGLAVAAGLLVWWRRRN